jgi:uracil-DNA glycosylase family 4
MTTKPGPLCHKCPLKDAPGPVWGEGSVHANLVVIGQCPGPEEISQGRPFIGGSGRILDNSLRRAGVERQSVFITNSVKCFVKPKTPVPQGAVACCDPLLRRELDSLEGYTTILTLGQEAFHGFTGKKMLTVSPPRSQKKPPNPQHWLRGAVYRVGQSKSVVPAAHPAFIASGGFRDATFFDADVAKAVRISKGLGEFYEEHYDYNPTSRQVLELCSEIEATGDFGADLETPEKSAAEEEEELLGSGKTEIQVCGLSHQPGWCIGVPGDMLSLLKPLFTKRRARQLYCRVFNWGFEGYHFTRQYGELSVVPVDGMLQLNRCYSDSKRKDLGTFLSLFTDMPYTKNLSRTDPDRYNACDTYGTLLASRKAQAFMVGMGIWEPYLTADVPLWQAVIDMKVDGTNCDVPAANRMELMCYKALEQYLTWWKGKLPTVDWQSSQQLIALFTALKLPQVLRKRVKKDKSIVKTPSCDQEVLEMYRDKHHNQLAGLLLTMRSLKKASDFTHIYASDGRAHPSHFIHGQKAGRIQAKEPDLQNIPEELAGIYPRTIIVPDDPNEDYIISADFEAIEFFIYGYAANDLPILKARKEGTYIYGLFYEEIFKRPFFLPGCPPKKPYRRKDIPPWELLVAKSGPLGMLYGRGEKSLEDGFGIPKSQAHKIYNDFFTEHWAVAAFHQVLMKEVWDNGYLRNYFNRIRWFPNPTGMRNEILAFPGQSNAADILIRNAIVACGNGIKDFGGRLLFPVHDSVQFTVPRRSLHGAVEFIRETLERPIPEMNNFWIPCVIKVGKNWGDAVVWEDFLAEHKGSVRDIQRVPARQATQ